MGISGRSIERDVSKEYLTELLYEYGGIIKDVAARLQCGRNTVYDYLDIYPELQEIRVEAANRLGDYEVESAYEVIEKCMGKVDEDAPTALKAASLVATKAKKSRYYQEKESKENVTNVYGDLVAGAKKEIQQSKNG